MCLGFFYNTFFEGFQFLKQKFISIFGKMTVEQRIEESNDQFPIGMHVLAVDDDPTCLMLLETLLRRCQYHVTTANQAVTALQMLRDNKDKYDLVISDVHMPDMDGFKLLELVGLEMDLPVIMLSGNDDPRLVMKGITHGACDYLLKPIRLEELKNIWQHVVRRKKLDSKGQKKITEKQNSNGTGEGGGQGKVSSGDPDQNGKLGNKRRKDQNEEEDEENDENTLENEELSTQKRARVVWSRDLHEKFVAAVHRLGIDKAVPKRILELMNVDKISRENVASHLQKYRLSLKKYSYMTSQQANMVSAYGGNADSSYARLASLNGLGNFNMLAGSNIQNPSFGSFSQNGMLGRFNTSAGLSVRGLSSPGLAQLNHGQNSRYPSNNMVKFQPVIPLQGNQNGNILQGMPISYEFDQFHDNKNVTNTVNNLKIFSNSRGSSDTKVPIGGTDNSLVGTINNPLVSQSRGGFGNTSSILAPSFGSNVNSHFPEHVKIREDWPSAVQSSSILPSSFSFNDSFKQQPFLSSKGLTNNMSRVGQLAGPPQHDSDNAVGPSQPAWNNPKREISHLPIGSCGLVNSPVTLGTNTFSLDQSFDQKMTNLHRNVDFNVADQQIFDDPSFNMLHNEVGNADLGTVQTQESFTFTNNYGSLEDLLIPVMNQDQENVMLGDFEYDSFPLKTCL